MFVRMQAILHKIKADYQEAALIEDPRNISFSEKKQLVSDYHDLLIKQDNVAEIAIAYEDIIREKYFVNTEGTEIFEELVTCILQGSITCIKDEEVQRVNFDFGGSDGFQRVRNLGIMLNLKHRPCKVDFGLLYGYRDYSNEDYQMVEGLLKVNNLEELSQKYFIAKSRYLELCEAHKERWG